MTMNQQPTTAEQTVAAALAEWSETEKNHAYRRL